MIGLIALASTAFAAVRAIQPQDWVTPNDYSSVAIQKKLQGDTHFRLAVSTTGKVIGCEVTEPSGIAELDGRVCKFMLRRGRFHPATDETGKAVLGIYRSRVRWSLPYSDGPVRYIRNDVLLWVKKLPSGIKSPATVSVALLVDASGKIEDCRADTEEFPTALNKAACDQARALLKPLAAIDEKAVPGRSVQNADIVFAVKADAP